ncbi:alpha/beta hydrolase fold domain-containing protein [Lentzea sp. NPDC058436]|uniref:alpha/beta hydrolase fold domain-containing protein n=1 Tax=Lentzea sp. NPDC058436 TaxID=3346499 RepID=UPI003665F87A
MYQTVIVLIGVLTAVALLPSPAPAFWVVRALTLSLAPPLALVAIALAVVAAVDGDPVFAVLAAVVCGAQVCVAGAQWGQALAMGARPSPFAAFFDLTGFLRARAPETHEVIARDGAALPLGVWHPADRAETGPAVVLVHGGGWAGGNWRQLRAYANWLADNGYRAVCVSYRLAPPARWDVAPFDVIDAVRWVEAHAGVLGVDPARIALFGSSAGGHLALLAASLGEPPSPRAVVSVYGPVDLLSLYDSLRRRRVTPVDREVSPLVDFLGGAPQDVPARWEWSSPIAHVESAPAHVCVVTGARDQWVPLETITPYAVAPEFPTLVALRQADHCFDLVWGSISAQTARFAVLRFLRQAFDGR